MNKFGYDWLRGRPFLFHNLAVVKTGQSLTATIVCTLLYGYSIGTVNKLPSRVHT